MNGALNPGNSTAEKPIRDQEIVRVRDLILREIGEPGVPHLACYRSAADEDSADGTGAGDDRADEDSTNEYGAAETPDDSALREILNDLSPVSSGDKARLASLLHDYLRRFRGQISKSTDPTVRWSGTSKEIAKRAVRRAVSIVDILREAASCKVKIRLFSVDLPPDLQFAPFLFSGKPGQLTIVNAIEVWFRGAPLESAVGLLFHSIRLTVQNRRALVTFLWPSLPSRRDGLLIWSDSDGEIAEAGQLGGLTPWAITSWMTAPHHGSRNPAHGRIWQGRQAEVDRYGVPNARYIHPIVSGDMRHAPHEPSPYFQDCPPHMRSCAACPMVTRALREDISVHRLGPARQMNLCLTCDTRCCI